jgi:hypothetical protein
MLEAAKTTWRTKSWAVHSKYALMKADWNGKVHRHALEQRLRPVLRARFIFAWREERRQRDEDNVSVGQKFVLDGLQAAGALVKDGWSNVNGFEHRFAVDTARPGVRVGIMPV